MPQEATEDVVFASPGDLVSAATVPHAGSFAFASVFLLLCRISTYSMLCIYNAYRKKSMPTGKSTGQRDVSKKDGKTSNKKNSQLVLRLDKDERDAFVDLCKQLDTSAAREIRRFIRGFMKENADD